jgi:ankyrin repeat protein
MITFLLKLIIENLKIKRSIRKIMMKMKQNAIIKLIAICVFSSVSTQIHSFDRVLEYFNVYRLHRAVNSENFENVKYLIDQGHDVNKQDQNSITPLQLAATKGNSNIAKFLLKNGANPDIKDNNGNVPLLVAAGLGYLDIAKILVQYGANIDSQNRDDAAPLHIATRSGKSNIAQFLLQNGANPDLQNQEGSTPLHIAAGLGYLDIAKNLTQNGANIALQNQEGQTAQDLARQENATEVVDILQTIQDANDAVEERFRKGNSPKAIINDGAQPTVVFEQANQTQKKKILQQYPEILYVYLYHNDKLNNVITAHTVPKTWLLYASRLGHQNILDTLIEENDSIRKDINKIKDKNGNRALHLAALYNHPSIAKYLISKNANPEIQNNDGQTPYDIAKENSFKKVGQILQEYTKTKQVLQQARRQYEREEESEAGRLPAELQPIIARETAASK